MNESKNILTTNNGGKISTNSDNTGKLIALATAAVTGIVVITKTTLELLAGKNKG